MSGIILEYKRRIGAPVSKRCLSTYIFVTVLLWSAQVWPNRWEHVAIPLTALLRALQNEYPAYRERAALSLGIKKDPAAVPALLKALAAGEPSPQVRASIYRALGRIVDARAADVLVTALVAEERAEVRAEVALALGDLGDPRTLDALIDTLRRNQDHRVRAGLVSALGAFPERAAVDALVSVADGADPVLMRRVARSLGSSGAQAAVVPLLGMLENASDPRLRIAVVDALAMIGAAAASHTLQAVLAETDSEILKTHIVVALGAIRDDSTVPVLVGLLDHGSPEQRYYAIQALSELRDASAAAPLASFYRDLARNLDTLSAGEYRELAGPLTISLRLQTVALRALYELDPATGLDAFVHGAKPRAYARDTALGLRLSTLAFEARRLAISGLGYEGSDRAFEVLTDDVVWKASDFRIRSTATRSLAVTGNPRAVEFLIFRLKDEHPEVRWTAANALGRLGDRHAMAPLRALFQDRHSEVRRQAVLSLGLLDARGLQRNVAQLAEHDASHRVRRAAAQVLDGLR